MDAEEWFVDTNVLIYATNAQSPWNQQATAVLNEARQRGVNFVISPQILREYLVSATRAAPSPLLSSAEALENVELFQKEFRIVSDTPDVAANLVTLVRQYGVLGKQVHDTNIVAVMLTHGVSRLLTHNVADFARFVK
ncbi:MAG TPA: PIN domain-containing protein [Thermoanaerobaculia bacterium]|nr:PIN domain-containing protein [Thermoanaerobaculia bacterium]